MPEFRSERVRQLRADFLETVAVFSFSLNRSRRAIEQFRDALTVFEAKAGDAIDDGPEDETDA